MNFVEDELKQLSIHNLRKIAREVGVKSPTSLIKENLITEILKVSNGIKSPHFSKKGRPCLKNEQPLYNQNIIIQEKIIEKPTVISEEKFAKITDLVNSCLKNIFAVLTETEN